MDFLSILSIIIFLVNLLLGLFVYRTNPKSRTNSLYFLITISLSLWIGGIVGARFVKYEGLFTLMGRIIFFGAILIGGFFFYFSQYFPKQNKGFPKWINIWAGFIIATVALLSLFTDITVRGTRMLDQHTFYPEFGNFYPYWSAIFLFFMGTGLVLMASKYKNAEGIEKTQIKYFFIGVVASSAIAITTNLFIPAVIGPSSVWQMGPLALFFWIVFTFYAIIKHHLMDIKVVTTELLVGLMAIILLTDLLLSKTLETTLIRSLIFLSFAYLGISLIQSVLLEIKRREETEEIARKLEEAYKKLQILDTAKTEFISMASHQLRTPLSTIKGYVSMLLEGSYGKLTKKTREKLINVSISNDRLIGIVNDLLNISKIELGKMEVDKKIIQIEEIITSVYEEMLHRAEEKNLQLLWNKPVKPLPKTAVDEPKIRQVISNIVDNALKYTEEGKIEINVQVAGPMIRIKVSDTGVGLSPEEINVIFSGFMRGSAGINLFVEGSGLGLYVARRYIDLHHGKIWADSRGKGLGSTFYIEIPITLNIDAEE